MSETPRTIVAEFFKRPSGHPRLHALYVMTEGYDLRSGCYDVEWSKYHNCYLFHLSGSSSADSAGGIYWATPGFVVKEEPCQWCSGEEDGLDGPKTRKIRERNITRRLRRLPMHLLPDANEDLLDWLDSNAIEDDAVFCSECDDWYPGNDLCEHCSGGAMKPGGTQRQEKRVSTQAQQSAAVKSLKRR